MKTTLKQFLAEAYRNLFTDSDKEKYIDIVWDMLQASYESCGGLKTKGLESKAGLVANTPMWKLWIKDEKVKIVLCYKEKGGRKIVAIGTDGTGESKRQLAKIMSEEFARSYIEVSDSLEAFLKKNLFDLVEKYKIPTEEVPNIIHNKITPLSDGYHYTRNINGEQIEKLMLGTPGKSIVR